MKVDIGCGKFKRKGYIGIDCREFEGVDYILNLDSDRLPFEDNSITRFYASHTLEHLTNLIRLMNEVYRCLKIGGKFEIEVPLFPDTGAIKDPTHVRYFIPESFDYFDRAWDYPQQPDYGINKFDIQKKEITGEYPYRVIKVILKK